MSTPWLQSITSSVTLVLLLLLTLSHTVPAMEDELPAWMQSGEMGTVISPCCQEGVKWSREASRCDNFPIRHGTHLACMTVIEVCCMKQRQLTACEEGKQTAMEGLRCAVMDTTPGAETFKECCHCCRLGKLAGGTSQVCHSPGLGDTCDTKYLQCCRGEVQPLANLTFRVKDGVTTPATTISTVTTSTPTTSTTPSTTGTTVDTTIDTTDTRDPTTVSVADTTSQAQENTTVNIAENCYDNNPCAQRCVPLLGGGVECRCYDGYRLNGGQCDDVDECSEGRALCSPSQRCVNTPGRFTCMSNTCPAGYDLDPDTGRCNPGRESCAAGFKFNPGSTRCEDINECGLGVDGCGTGERCENTVGSYMCRRQRHCGTGYTLDEESQRCQDNDECELGTHNCGRSYKCKNVQGSFRCDPITCERGFRFDRQRQECVLVKCPKGLRPNWANKCQDINECAEFGASVCRRHQRCVNTRGSYYCRSVVNCPPGYEATENSGCQDINECERGSHRCGPGQQCINRQGTYFCQCPRGMRHDNSGSCIDVDECSYGAAICPSNSKCVNTIGSFSCECVDGLVADGNDQCADVDECEQEGICQQKCVNVVGTFFCSCNRGYQLRDDKRSCEDIDECTQFRGRDGRVGVCGGQCINTPGSYQCQCSEGWRLKIDNRGCEDIDECADNSATCTAADSRCVNTRGGYKCPVIVCPEGFIKTNGTGRRNSVRCKRVSTNCPECRRGLISRTFNFISFASNVIVPAPLFSMTGSRLVDKYYTWGLELEEARPYRAGVKEATVQHFSLERKRHFARVTLVRRIEGPQDVVLRLSMNVSSYYSGFEGMAESRIYLYVTDENDV